MIEADCKRAGEKSAVFVARLVRVQRRAIGWMRFVLGIECDGRETIVMEEQNASEIRSCSTVSPPAHSGIQPGTLVATVFRYRARKGRNS
jgi:hypothetical protein